MVHCQCIPWLNLTPPSVVIIFLNIPGIFHGIFDIQKFCLFLLCTIFFWNIPGIFHIPIFWIILLLQFLFGIFHIPKVRKKRCERKNSEYSIFLLNEKKRCGMKKLEYSMFRFQRLKFWVTYKMEYFLGTKKSEILTLPPQYFVSIGEHLPPTYCVILQRVRIFQVWIFTYAFRRLAYLIIVIFPSFLRACLSCVLSLFLGNFFSACGEPLLPWYYLKLFSRLRRAQYSCDSGL